MLCQLLILLGMMILYLTCSFGWKSVCVGGGDPNLSPNRLLYEGSIPSLGNHYFRGWPFDSVGILVNFSGHFFQLLVGQKIYFMHLYRTEYLNVIFWNNIVEPFIYLGAEGRIISFFKFGQTEHLFNKKRLPPPPFPQIKWSFLISIAGAKLGRSPSGPAKVQFRAVITTSFNNFFKYSFCSEIYFCRPSHQISRKFYLT